MSQDDFASFMNDAGAARTQKLTRGQRVSGAVVHISTDSVFLDLDTRADGRVARQELVRPDGTLKVAIGDTLEATVVDPDAEGGPLLAVVLGRDGGLDVSALELAQETGTAVEGTFSKAIKGGFEVDVAGVRAFCPTSQVGAQAQADRDALLGQTARFEVLEVRDEGRSVVVSRRRALERERAEVARGLLENLGEGDTVEGEVSSIQSYGAFVDLGGLEGLVHISELSAQRVSSVEDAVSVGEKVRVKVLAIEQSKDGLRLRLSMKALQQPAAAAEAPAPGEVLTGQVVRHLPHGLLVNTPKGEGMVPVRELALPQGGDHRRVFPVGHTLEVVRLDGRGDRVRFSALAVEDVRAQNAFREYRESADEAASAGLGAMASQLSKLQLGKLPKGPPPAVVAPKPVAAPAPASAAVEVPASPPSAAPEAAGVAPSQGGQGPGAAAPGEPPDDSDKAPRRRIVRGRK